jgi:hypothetical protein
MAGWNDFFFGSKEKHKRVSTLRDEQEPIYQQLTGAAGGKGAGGAFGESADYYRNLLSDNPEDYQAFAAPEMRKFHEEIVPGLSEQFAGMGAGGLSSSGFRNAAVGAGTDLAERLGAIRAGLRQQGAQGLQNIGQQALGNYSEDRITQQGSEGFLPQAANMAVKAGLNYATGGVSGLVDQGLNAFGAGKVGGKTSPYGGGGGGFKGFNDVKFLTR